jgi:peptidoglycan/LPS O-acetylase OafA/YrhL
MQTGGLDDNMAGRARGGKATAAQDMTAVSLEAPAFQSRAAGEIKTLTAIRGIAALGIVLFHMQFLLPDFEPGTGYLFVDLFFLLSGFIMSHVHGDDFRHSWRRPYARFLALRIVRIYPLYIFVLALYLGLETAKLGAVTSHPAFSINTLASFWRSLFMVQSWHLDTMVRWNVPGWSISSEWAAYLLTPALFSAVLYSSARAALPFVAACGVLLWWLYAAHGWLNLTYDFGAVRCVAEYSIGIALYRIYRTVDRNNASLGRQIAWVLPAALILSLANVIAAGNDLLTVALFAVDILGLALVSGRTARLFSSAPAMFLGRISYSLYMVQFLLIQMSGMVMRRYFPTSEMAPINFAFAAAAVILSLIAATFLFNYVEKPTRQVGRRLMASPPA